MNQECFIMAETYASQFEMVRNRLTSNDIHL